MTVVVRTPEITARVAQRVQQEWSGVDLWVTVGALERHVAAAEISAALSRASGDAASSWRVYPTTGGTYVWLDAATTWEGRVERLAAELERRGHDGFISVAPVEVWPSLQSEHPYPTAVMAHRMEPPVTEGPFNVMGMPEYRWGVPASVNERLLAQAAAWVCLPGTEARVGEIAFIPVTPDDAVEILDLLTTRGARPVRLGAHSAADAGLRRTVGFETWGQSAWSEVDGDADPTELAEGLARRLVELAPDLDVAAVHPTFPGAGETSYVTTGIWNLNRHLWASFVPDAFGIQLLTSEHLQRAQDLSGWTVEEVGPDRWIVRARDLAAWFDVPDGMSLRQQRFPSPEMRAQAREDFGEMILTRAAAKANPRPAPGQ